MYNIRCLLFQTALVAHAGLAKLMTFRNKLSDIAP